jgi:hypothetical protein
MIGRPTAALGFVGVRNKGYTKRFAPCAMDVKMGRRAQCSGTDSGMSWLRRYTPYG